jgi:hypothetical protein
MASSALGGILCIGELPRRLLESRTSAIGTKPRCTSSTRPSQSRVKLPCGAPMSYSCSDPIWTFD